MFVNMNWSDGIFEDLFINTSRSKFFCPNDPLVNTDSKKNIYHQLGIAITAVVSPVTIFLNILVILAIKKTRKLWTNPDILIIRLAASDLLVPAVSAPWIISLDLIILRGTESQDIVCTITDLTKFLSSTF